MNTSRTSFVAVLATLVLPIAASAEILVGTDNISVVHKSSGGMTIAFPDVCKTPAPPGPVPIPYPNTGASNDTSQGSKDVKASVREKPTDTARRPVVSSKRNAGVDKPAVYALEAKTEGRLYIRQTVGRDSVTTATYVDGKGKESLLREPALIRLANGGMCAVCASQDGTVTAVYRLLPDEPQPRPEPRSR